MKIDTSRAHGLEFENVIKEKECVGHTFEHTELLAKRKLYHPAPVMVYCSNILQTKNTDYVLYYPERVFQRMRISQFTRFSLNTAKNYD
jgi:hypothetical protein